MICLCRLSVVRLFSNTCTKNKQSAELKKLHTKGGRYDDSIANFLKRWHWFILLGLSSSPVVGLVVGSITALLASLIGLKNPATDDDSGSQILTNSQFKLAGLRTGSFGLACVLGIFVGIYMRTHNVLSPVEPTLKVQFNELTQIGFSPKEARDLLVHYRHNRWEKLYCLQLILRYVKRLPWIVLKVLLR